VRPSRWSGASRAALLALALGPGCGDSPTGHTQTPPQASPSPPPALSQAVDDFERPLLGPNWTVYSDDVGIVNASDLGVLSRGQLGIAAWSASRFSADQFCEAEVSSDADLRGGVQVFVRRRSSDRQRYGFHWNPRDRRWEIKRDGGPAAPVLVTGGGSPLAPGDTIRVEAVGTTLRGFRNGALVLTASDSVITEAGEPGIAINLNLEPVARFPAPFVEIWRGGSLPR
jgi:hypothetical protein